MGKCVHCRLIGCRCGPLRPPPVNVTTPMCEGLFATLECELLDRRKFQTKAKAHMAVFQFIEGWYNPGRRHSALGYQSPINYEWSVRERLEPVTVHETGGTPTPEERLGQNVSDEQFFAIMFKIV